MKRETVKTEQVLMVMHILAWISLVGFIVNAGAILISFGVSYVNPEGAKNLYKGLDLYELRQLNFGYYAGLISFWVALLFMKSYVFFLVTKILSKITIANPFKMEVAQMIERISYVIFEIWIIGIISDFYTDWLQNRTGMTFDAGTGGELFFMAGLIFIISQVFKRGVEIQSENELTV